MLYHVGLSVSNKMCKWKVHATDGNKTLSLHRPLKQTLVLENTAHGLLGVFLNPKVIN